LFSSCVVNIQRCSPVSAKVAAIRAVTAADRARVRASVVEAFRSIRMGLRDLELALKPVGSTTFVSGVH
jgi:hypothetical protein